ncbi:MAG: hypothetical protein FJ030_15175 [Chloroflexi bacterium]|nr:hypothetical protein [Chloroflexota bacterium]
MSRSTVYKREEKKNELNPVWRGIGCLLIVFIFTISYVGSWMALDYLTGPDFDDSALPRQLAVLPSAFRQLNNQMRDALPWLLARTDQLPWLFGTERPRRITVGTLALPGLIAIVASVFFYGLITIAWGFVRGDTRSPLDVRTSTAVQQKRKIRRCR